VLDGASDDGAVASIEQALEATTTPDSSRPSGRRRMAGGWGRGGDGLAFEHTGRVGGDLPRHVVRKQRRGHSCAVDHAVMMSRVRACAVPIRSNGPSISD
jgi:hypothetical protein